MSEKEHSVDFLMIKLLHVYAAKIFHQLSHVNLHSGADADAGYSLSAGGTQPERNLQPSVYQTVYGDGVPAANGKSSSDLPGG